MPPIGVAAPAQGPGSASVFRPHTPAGAVQPRTGRDTLAWRLSRFESQLPTTHAHSAGSRTYTLAAAAASSVPRRRAHRRRCLCLPAAHSDTTIRVSEEWRVRRGLGGPGAGHGTNRGGVVYMHAPTMAAPAPRGALATGVQAPSRIGLLAQ